MQRGLERRLARAEAGAGRIDDRREAERAGEEYRRFRERMVEAIRAGLIAAGLNPADAACLNREPEWIPPPPRPSPRDRDAIGEIEKRFARFIDLAREEPPDLAQASMAELYAVYGMGAEDAGDTSPSPPDGGRGPAAAIQE